MNPKLQTLINQFNTHLSNFNYINDPTNLYTPITHILNLQGKRLRPLISLMIYDLINQKLDDQIFATATAIELFHNFTLIHDDIIDNSNYRRGTITVHKKYGVNSGILSGDALMILAYQQLDTIAIKHLPQIFRLFNSIAIGVCEGQQMDINFETSDTISLEEYFEMIRLKTSILVGLSFKIPIILSDKGVENENLFFGIGERLGLLYQLQDDYLDCFGKFEKFGKPIGNDILLNKKTALSILAKTYANTQQKQQLLQLQNEPNKELKIKNVISLFQEIGVHDKIQIITSGYLNKIIADIDSINFIDNEGKKFIKEFVHSLINREI